VSHRMRCLPERTLFTPIWGGKTHATAKASANCAQGSPGARAQRAIHVPWGNFSAASQSCGSKRTCSKPGPTVIRQPGGKARYGSTPNLAVGRAAHWPHRPARFDLSCDLSGVQKVREVAPFQDARARPPRRSPLGMMSSLRK
jgi:hypothetical protein